jgi:hypothetical protein
LTNRAKDQKNAIPRVIENCHWSAMLLTHPACDTMNHCRANLRHKISVCGGSNNSTYCGSFTQMILQKSLKRNSSQSIWQSIAVNGGFQRQKCDFRNEITSNYDEQIESPRNLDRY